MRSTNAFLGCAVALIVTACGQSTNSNQAASPAASAEQKKTPAAVDSNRLLAADEEAGQWMAPGRTYSEQRYSPLNQINDTNVGQLGLAWYFDLNTHRGLESSPLVIDGVMYTISAWNITYAIDARTGKQLWRYDPQVDRSRARFLCCDVVNAESGGKGDYPPPSTAGSSRSTQKPARRHGASRRSIPNGPTPAPVPRACSTARWSLATPEANTACAVT
jgi:glucose dehydrogenase